MFIGTVVGSLWATRKDEKLNGLKFMLVEKQLNEDEVSPELVVAVDQVGAGVDEQVLVTTGSSARVTFENRAVPVDMVIVGIIDSVEFPKKNDRSDII